MRQYISDPKEIYVLELNKLQHSFSDIHRIGEHASEFQKVEWRHVQYLRHINWILQEAVQTGEVLINNISD